MRFSLRLATTLCYFLPFTFFLAACGDMGYDFSYNKKEAAKKILLSNQNFSIMTTDSDNTDTNTLAISAPILEDEAHTNFDSIISDFNAGLNYNHKTFSERLFIEIISPARSSVSAVGVVLFYKDRAGKIFIVTSMLLSLILFIGYRWIKSKKIICYGLLINIISVSAFICDSFFSDVTLLYGAWVLLFLLIVQVILERDRL
jgi:phosphoglycerol transferase MdoB-like AlkP superfamily enzyme